jgi:predicted acylesterase/phospholipase RssA
MATLEALGIQVRASSGCSAGAVVGGVIASGANIQDWTDAITHADSEQFWTPRSALRLLYSLVFKKGHGLSGLSDTAASVRFLSKHPYSARTHTGGR